MAFKSQFYLTYIFIPYDISVIKFTPNKMLGIDKEEITEQGST